MATDLRKKAAVELVRASSQGNSSQARYRKMNGTSTPGKIAMSESKKRSLEDPRMVKLSQTQLQTSIREIPDNF